MSEGNVILLRRKEHRYQQYLVLSLTLLLSSGEQLIHASTLNDQKTIHFRADTCLIDNNTNIRICQGHISLTQGSRLLTADHATSYLNRSGELIKIIALGHPAVYRALVSQNQTQLIAMGNTIYYYPPQGYLEAVGEAQIIQGKNHFQGPRIHYDANKKTIDSHFTQGGHTRILLAPITH